MADVQASITGNVSGQVAVGNHILQMGDINGDIVYVVQQAPRAAFEKRTRPVSLRPRPYPALLDREAETAVFRSALGSPTIVSVFGEEGIGKTTLLSHMAHLPETKNFPDGVVYHYLRDQGLEDILQLIFDSFHVSGEGIMPTAGQLRHGLHGIQAVILLDNLKLSREDIQALVNAMPASSFIMSSAERRLWGEEKQISLNGLPESDGIKLFERELARALSVEEAELVKIIWRLLQGHPLRMVQAAALVRDRGQSISQIRDQLLGQPASEAITKASLNSLNASQQRALAVLGAAGDAAIPLENIGAFSKVKNAEVVLKSLVALGLAWAQGSRYRLTGAVAGSIGNIWDLSPWEDAMLDYFANWINQQPEEELVEEASDVLAHAIQLAGEKKRWSAVISIGRALERILIIRKRWQSWLEVLKLIQKAAQAIGDQKTEGWVLHQLGSRALCLNHANQARQFLTQAFNIRQAIGDKAGLEVTQHNLNALPSSHMQVKNNHTNRFGKYAAYGAGGAAGIGLLVLIALLLLPNILYPPQPIPSQTPVTPSTSTIAFTTTASFTPIIIPPPTETNTLTLTPTPTPTITPSLTLTPSITPTNTPSQTPFVIITTPAPKAIVLYDFVAEASHAKWYNLIFDVVSSHPVTPTPVTVKFYTAPPSNPIPECFGSAYAGWESKPPLEDGSIENTVILAYPYGERNIIEGHYDLTSLRLRAGDYISARVGYKDASENCGGDDVNPGSDGVTFRVYFYEKDPQQVDLLAEKFDNFDDKKAHDWLIVIPSRLVGKSGWFILAVDPGIKSSGSDWSVWMDATFIGLPR